MYLKSEQHANDFVIHVIKTWNTPRDDVEDLKILGYCHLNTVSLYDIMKRSKIENKTWIKYGAIQTKGQSTIKSTMIKINDLYYNPFHYWIVIEINGRNIVLDISKIFIDYYQKHDPKVLNKEFKRMFGNEMYWKKISNEFIYMEKTDGHLFDRKKGFIVQKGDDPKIITEIVSCLKTIRSM